MQRSQDNPFLANLTPNEFVERMVREILERRKLGRRKGPKKRVQFRVPVSVKEALREASKKFGVTMTEIVIWMMEQFLPILQAAEPIELTPEYRASPGSNEC